MLSQEVECQDLMSDTILKSRTNKQ